MNEIIRIQTEKFISKNLKKRRLDLGYSRKDLGHALNISERQIKKFEEAAVPISAGKLYVFAQILKVPVRYFFDNAVQQSISLDIPVNFTHNGDDKLSESSEKHHVTGARQKELSSLVRAFIKVQNPQLRNVLVELVRSVASVSSPTK